MYESIVKTHEIQRRIIKLGVLTQIERGLKITDCQMIGIKKKQIGLEQFIEQYKDKIEKRQKDGQIHKNKTLQFEKRAYIKKYGSIKYKKESSKSSNSCQSIEEQKFGKKPVQKEDKKGRKKLNLVSGSEEQNISVQKQQQRISLLSRSLQVSALDGKADEDQKKKRTKSIKERGNQKESKKGRKGKAKRLQQIKQAEKMLQLSNKNNHKSESKKALRQNEPKESKQMFLNGQEKLNNAQHAQQIKNSSLQNQPTKLLEKNEKKTHFLLEKIKKKEEVINEDSKGSLEFNNIEKINENSRNNSLASQNSSSVNKHKQSQQKSKSTLQQIKRKKKGQPPQNNKKLDQFFKKN